ncbi:MAG: hypothetical protein J6M59_04530 [Bacteroidaceae bacterium]|nr:hypothetical protein [Bacteroidaceae bacterium]
MRYGFLQRWEFLRPFGSKRTSSSDKFPILFSAKFLRPFGSKSDHRSSGKFGFTCG